jgi:hypothetical protein
MFLLISVCLNKIVAQEFTSISGKILDVDTSAPLPFASVILKHTSSGTIANAEGMFTINVSNVHAHDTLHISMMGYDAWQLPILMIANRQDLTVKLKEASVFLPEVVIVDSVSTKVILKRAYNHLRDNYAATPFQQEGFYREIQKADGQNVSLIESVTLTHSDGFKRHTADKIKLLQLKKGIGYTNPYVIFWDNKNLLLHFVGQNFVKYKSKALVNYKEAHRKKDTSIDGVMVYVIEIRENSGFWPSTIYVRCDNYAIIRTEERFRSDTDGERRWRDDNNPKIEAITKHKFLQVNFKLYNGKYYPDNYRMTFHTVYKDTATGKQLLDFEINQQMVVTELLIENLVAISEKSVLKESVSLKTIPDNYDPKVWGKYSTIRETSLDALIRRDLEWQVKEGK